MERVQAPPGIDETAEVAVPSLATVRLRAEHLPELAARAREAGQEGADAQRDLELLLAALQPTAADGELLLSLLEAGSFSGLLGEAGTPTRALAIEALLRLGYPWSIQVQPDDLAWYREHQKRQGKTRLMILLGILGVELLAAGYLWFFA